MIELDIGTRFYHNGKLCKIVETEDTYKCKKCILSIDECFAMNCESRTREDGKNICFKLVEDTEENNETRHYCSKIEG